LPDSVKEALRVFAEVKAKAAADVLPRYYNVLDELQKRMRSIREQEDEEYSRQLDHYLGGFLGARWREVRADYNEKKAEYDRLNAEFKNLSDEGYNRKGSELLGYDYNRANWMEAEADQVSLELLLRAGFVKSSGQQMAQMLVREGEGQLGVDQCSEIFNRLMSGASSQLPERGQWTHPTSCWRMVNLGYTELKLHEGHYSQWFGQAVTVDKFPGELEQLKSH
jgi:hypothetical protein